MQPCRKGPVGLPKCSRCPQQPNLAPSMLVLHNFPQNSFLESWTLRRVGRTASSLEHGWTCGSSRGASGRMTATIIRFVRLIAVDVHHERSSAGARGRWCAAFCWTHAANGHLASLLLWLRTLRAVELVQRGPIICGRAAAWEDMLARTQLPELYGHFIIRVDDIANLNGSWGSSDVQQCELPHGEERELILWTATGLRLLENQTTWEWKRTAKRESKSALNR